MTDDTLVEPVAAKFAYRAEGIRPKPALPVLVITKYRRITTNSDTH
jgi:hypothetical protein